MKLISILGARPQFIKAAPVSRALREAGHREILVHTGQHYDYDMSEIFFDELELSEPDINLGVGSGAHGWQTGRMLIKIEEVLLKEKPDWVLVYGDTNSTLAGALAAVKLRVPLAHVEAGLRSFNHEMPEEHNRVLTDHCCDVLFCPTRTAVRNLQKEGFVNVVNKGKLIEKNFNHGLTTDNGSLVINIGDTMYDAVLMFSETALTHLEVLKRIRVKPKGYFLATIHRPYNADDPAKLKAILDAFFEIGEPVIFPVHPRTRKRIAELGLRNPKSKMENLKLIDPIGYLDMLALERNARVILTDSGGMQKEAYLLGVPCVTLRPETEWIETVEAGWNVVVGADSTSIVRTAHDLKPLQAQRKLFGDGQAANRILQTLENTSP